MRDPWSPERVVDLAEAAGLVGSRFPELRGAPVESLGEGWDNTVYLVGGEWVFRFPRRQVAVPLIEAEIRVLPRLASVLPLAIPEPRFVGGPSEGYPWPFYGYRLLPGRTACRARPSVEARVAAAPLLGGFLRALHAVDAVEAGAPPDTLRRADLPPRVLQMHERLDRLQERGVLADARPWHLFLEEAPVPGPTAEPRLLHGDLYARHLLLDPADRPVGVLDWGDIHVGDPAVDLGIAYSFLPAGARGALFDVYGPVDEATAARARLRGLFHAVAIALYGHAVDDGDLQAEGRLGMEFVLQG